MVASILPASAERRDRSSGQSRFMPVCGGDDDNSVDKFYMKVNTTLAVSKRDETHHRDR